MGDPLVSIIVPVYNTARYLPELFGSLLRQTYENLEIICINDGSKDDSLGVLQSYAKNDERIVVIDKENSGAGRTRNMGLDNAHGAYICFVDSDDFIEKNAIELLVKAAEENSADVVVFGLDQYDDCSGEFTPNTWAVSATRIPVRTVFCAADIDHFYKYLVGFTANKLYRADFLLGLDLRFPDVGAHEDLPFTYTALSASKRTYYLDEVLYHYRRAREGSLSDETNERYGYMIEALLLLREGLKDRGLWRDYERNFVNYALHMCIWKHSVLSRFERIEFRDSCRRNLFEELGILGHEDSYFFEPEERRFINDALNMTFSRKAVAFFVRKGLLH